jgi:DNA-binding NtrC family response regulator
MCSTRARARDERTAVLLMTAYGTIESAVEAMRRGAFDFVQKPFDLEQLEVRVGKALEHGRLVREVKELRAERAQRFAPENVIGTSPRCAPPSTSPSASRTRARRCSSPARPAPARK